MQLIKKLVNKLNGLHYPQEYLCLAKETLEQPLRVYLINGQQVVKDITDRHLFTGYSPLIFTLCSLPADRLNLPDTIEVVFSDQALQPNEFLGKKDAIARLSFKMIRQQLVDDITIFFYEGVHGEHHFLSSFHQYMISLYNRLYNKKQGNVFLGDNLYKQVQIAYAVPRTISLITTGDGAIFNLFPTDLHGPIGDQYYVSSLRHDGRACQQVESIRRLVISEIHADAYKLVYSLGKNHMQELKPKENFPFGNACSSTLQFPLPQRVLYYRELELMDSFKQGIHKLLLYRIIGSTRLNNEPATLAHVHNVYATWRHNKGLAGNYLLR